MNPHFDWKRFWHPRSTSISLSDGGYLSDPEGKWGKFLNPNVVTFDEISTIRCLGLLGEPGTGKSHALQSEINKINGYANGNGGSESILFNLGSYSSEDRLVEKLFESSTFVSWLSGDHELHLFLDSLDESLLRVDTVAALLIDELKNCPKDRLYLRVACRTADWPHVLERGLREFWGEEQVGIYELAPLRRIDVEQALVDQEILKSTFIEEVHKKKAVSLAIKPVTLHFLMNTMKKTGELPRTQMELYLHGCLLLCTETNDSLTRLKRKSDLLSPKQRLLVAGRVAAVTVFSNRYAVWVGTDWGNVPEEDVVISDLCGGKEYVDGDAFSVTEEAIRETFSYGLFSSRGLDRLGWAHQTYAEFLAAYYLVERGLTTDQLMSLLIHPSDVERKLIPQLHQEAAWLANMESTVIEKIIMHDPVALLNADVESFDDSKKELLVGALLEAFNQEKIVNDYEISSFFYKLNHPKLSRQLEEYIIDSSIGRFARRAAIQMVRHNHVESLSDSLIQVIFDPNELQNIRERAGNALCGFVDIPIVPYLRRMANGEAGADPDDNLKGCALQALWPEHITAKELFDLLTYPKRRNYRGPYQAFLTYLIENLTPSDIPWALEWLCRNLVQDRHFSSFDKLQVAIMQLAWEHFEDDGVLERYSIYLLQSYREKNYISNGVIGHDLRGNHIKRKKLISSILNLIHDESEIRALFLEGIVLSDDLSWLIEQIDKSRSKMKAKHYALLAWDVFDSTNKEQVEIIYEASKRIPHIAKKGANFFAPVDITSSEAINAKKYYEKRLKRANDQIKNRLEPPPSVRVLQALEQFEIGDLEKWWGMNLEMTLESDSAYYGSELESDLMQLPGWQEANEHVRDRIVNAAKNYVTNYPGASPNEWLAKDMYYEPALAGHRALKLLWNIHREFVNCLPSEVWDKWASIILAYPMSSSEYQDPIERGLVNLAYQYAPDEIIRTLLVLIDEANVSSDHVFILEKMEGCWDRKLCDVLVEKVQDSQLKPSIMASILQKLFEHGDHRAKAIVMSYIHRFQSHDSIEVSKAVIAASVFLSKCSSTETWDTIWSLLQNHMEFGRKVITDISTHYDRPMLLSTYTEMQVAQLYVWMTKQFPHAEDPNSDNETMAHFVGPREQVADLRDNMLELLKVRGTHEACDAIRWIMGELPELSWLKWSLLEAQKTTRFMTWNPVPPSDVLELAQSPQKRLIQDGNQLLDVLIESLEQLDKKLQGETPIAFTLWNEAEKNIFKPKDEERLSDLVKSHLQDDLRQRALVVNREVQIRQGFGSGKGERTDIQVNAIAQDSRRRTDHVITVIIEVKGCWHKELNTALQTQLTDRYLRDNSCDHGLYLVGWFSCDQWTDADNRKKQTPKMSLEEARTKFEGQAISASKNGKQIRSFVLNTALR